MGGGGGGGGRERGWEGGKGSKRQADGQTGRWTDNHGQIEKQRERQPVSQSKEEILTARFCIQQHLKSWDVCSDERQVNFLFNNLFSVHSLAEVDLSCMAVGLVLNFVSQPTVQ